jgi:hypothetical protein
VAEVVIEGIMPAQTGDGLVGGGNILEKRRPGGPDKATEVPTNLEK